ncbi:helix-turn-helix domain-containing protein [Adhaeribacter terreus]|uniref:Multiprotein-bridging factor 1 family protein n=1 Tax=Adhaeribacter terreus TaxID=529703 RepID=A0ABW0E9B6_9BACT
MKSKFFDKIVVSEETKRFVSKSFEIGDEILRILKEKNMTQKELAEKLGKKESQVSKWLTGTHNFTLKTISQIEAILNADIILVPKTFEIHLNMEVQADNPESNLEEKDFVNVSFNKRALQLTETEELFS